jgi:glyoxylase-like metal-dependent hydrolase (beta-lactamase superfamily II)
MKIPTIHYRKLLLRGWIALITAGTVFYGSTAMGDSSFADGAIQITTFNLFVSNVHLVEIQGKKILVDIGEVGQEEKIEKKLKKKGYTPADIDLIILTHGHADHAGGAHYFQQKYRIPVLVGEGDVAMIRRGKNDTLVPTSGLAKLVRKHIANNDRIPPFDPDYVVKDTFDLQQIGIPGKVVAIPGHTPGSVMVIFNRCAFVGDLFRGAMLAPQSPREHFFQSDTLVIHRHIRHLLNQPYERFYTGHGGPFAPDKVEAYFLPKR